MTTALHEVASGPASLENDRDWLTAAELAELRLPGLPTDKGAMNRRIREERWRLRVDNAGAALARPRSARGGGVEYHVSLLPGAARLELAQRGLVDTRPGPAEAEPVSAGSWRWYDLQSEKTKADAAHRLSIVSEIMMLEEAGCTRTAALADISFRHQIGTSTLWSWLKLVEGVARSDWLPALSPRRKGGGVEADIDSLLWSIFKSDFLRNAEPTLSSCYERTAKIAAERGLSIPSERTLRRRLEREIDPGIILRRRKGDEALRRSVPSQRRTVAELHALECVNIDGHKFDVFVRLPDGRTVRPILVGIQDVYSSKIVAWRIGEVESAVLTRLAFADLFANYGIPKHCVLDNGRAFASKWITGGAKTRYRFKIKDEEPTGILTALGIQIHWAIPYRGQSKPIERAWRDLCDTISRHPLMEGAYTGNNPVNKPANYGSRTIEWDAFVAHVEAGIHAHNSRLKRRGRHYAGRSFDEVFTESFAVAPIGRATPEQLRMALLTAEQVTVNRQTGEVALFGNRYWSEPCVQLAGQRVTVRFDPDHLDRDLHLYGLDGGYLTSAQMIADTGFLTAAGAQDTAKRAAAYRKRVRDGELAEQLLAAEEVARLQADAPAAPIPEPSVVRPMRHRGQTAAALKPVPALATDLEARVERENRVFSALSLVRLVE